VESVAAKSSEAAMVGPGTAWHIHRDEEERTVVVTAAEVILPHGAAGGKLRHGDEVRTIGARGTHARQLDSGIDAEWRASHESRHVQKLPALGQRFSERMQEADVVERQQLND